MTRLRGARHGETYDREAGLWPTKGTELTARGIAQAESAGLELRDDPPKIIIASPLERTWMTAAIIAGVLGYNEGGILLLPLAVERDFGPLAGTPMEPFRDDTLPYAYLDNISGVEPLDSLHDRGRRTLELIACIGADVVLVGHKAHIRGMALEAADRPFTDVYAPQGTAGLDLAQLNEIPLDRFLSGPDGGQSSPCY